MAEIKTDGNASERPIKDRTAGVCCITYNTRHVVKSRWYIRDPTAMT